MSVGHKLPIVTYRAADLIANLGGTLHGNPDAQFARIGTLAEADGNCIAFLANPKYQSQLAHCKASVIIASRQALAAMPALATAIITEQPYLYYARVSQLLAPAKQASGVDVSARIDSTATIGTNVSIGAFAVIEANARVADNVSIGSHCVIGQNSEIGQGSLLYPHVTIYSGCKLGKQVVLHSGVVIGADGFGYAAQGQTGWLKIAQLGGVVIGDDVEIGANTTIDRGAIGNTIIGHGCKLDNQIQIAHNVVIGDFTAIAACAGIAGSTTIGQYCLIGGAVGIVGHLTICDKVTISAMSLVTKNIKESGTYTGAFPLMENRDWERSAVLVKQLEDMRSRIKVIEKELAQSSAKNTKV